MRRKVDMSSPRMFRNSGPFNKQGMDKYTGFSEIYKGQLSDVYEVELAGQFSQIVQENSLYNFSKESYTLENISHRQVINTIFAHYNTVYEGADYEDTTLTVFDENILVVLKAKVRNEYIELKAQYIYNTLDNKLAAEQNIKKLFGNCLLEGNFVDIDWVYGHKAETTSIKELVAEDFINEAYPTITPSLEGYVDRYLSSHESVLILLGSPGLGKSRFIRYLFKRYIKRSGEKPSVLYGANQETIQNENVFTQFLQKNYQFLVLEDLDQSLAPRKDGNLSMTNLLTTADGLIQNLNRKIIITTNLPNVRDIDDALVRKGRCFDVHKFRSHTPKEARKFLDKFDKSIILPDQDKFSLAELYSLTNKEEND